MAGIKYEEKIYFPCGSIYVLYDDELGITIYGENGIDGDLIEMGAWDFNNREAWTAWGHICITHIQSLSHFVKKDLISDETAQAMIRVHMEKLMPPIIAKHWIDHEEEA